MKAKEIWGAVLIGFSTILTETHAYILDHYPKSINIDVDIFISPNYKNEVNCLWLVKMIFESLNIIVILFVLMQLANTFKMFLIFGLYWLYYICDFFLLLWNFKETADIYRVLLAVITSVSILLMVFYKKRYKLHSV